MIGTRRGLPFLRESLLLIPLAASAQDVIPVSSGGRTVSAVRLQDGENLRIDGSPDEPAWQRAQPASDFLQRDPNNGAPATAHTEVRILYDAERLILGVVLHDSDPGGPLGNQMQRDQSFDADDRFMWTIDTFLDGRSGYFFEINPAGAMGDGLVDPSLDDGFDGLGAGVNKSWDGIWLARVRRTAAGWTAEVEIPFGTLNFDPNTSTWGVNFQRTLRRKNEDVLWSGHARNQGLARMSNAGRLNGIDGISQGVGLDLKPYAVGNMASAPGRERPSAVTTAAMGLDAFYNLTPALRANVSLNTDFAETEVDERRVNLTRFPLFFPEKRDFFLEGSSFFDFSREGEDILPFFSRRIGLDERGTPQPIDVAAKMTGQVGAFDIGVLQARTRENHAGPGEDFSVLRFRRRALEQSYVGALYTRRSARTSGDVDRHTAGLDFEFQTSTFRGEDNLDFSGFYLWTSNPVATGNNAAYGVRLSYPNDPFSAAIAMRDVQPSYDPAVGFVERRGYRHLNPSAEYSPRLRNHPLIRGFEFSVDYDLQNDISNRPLTREFELTPLEVDFNDGSRFGVEVAHQYERLEDDFDITDDIVLPAGGTYRFASYQIGGSTADHRAVSVSGDMSFGGFFSGRRQEYSLEVGVRPRRGIALALEAERNLLDFGGQRYETDVFRAVMNTQFSPWVSVVNNLQYDSVSGLLGWQMRFRWIKRPGNDLHVVYTHNWQEFPASGARRLETLDNRLATKFAYTFRF